jgi:DNA-binding response OmpR family regulator
MSPTERILVVDDERIMRITLAEILSLEGYDVTAVDSGQEALARLEQGPFELMLTDLRMPGIDGVQLIEAARRLAPQMIIIVLTAHATLDSAVRALRHGAHDYLFKPARAEEIVASVRAGLSKRAETTRREQLYTAVERVVGSLENRGGGAAPDDANRRLEAHGLSLDRATRTATLDGRALELTRVEFDLIALLVEHIDEVVTCAAIVRAVQGYNASEDEARRIVRVHLSRLRQKVEQSGARPLPIVNVRGVGYRLLSSVS